MQQVWMWNVKNIRVAIYLKLPGVTSSPCWKKFRPEIWLLLVVFEKQKCLRNKNFLVVTSSPCWKEFRPEIYSLLSTFDVVCLKRWGYLRIIWSSRSHVNSGPRFEFHRTLTIGILLCLSCLTSWSMISTGSYTNRSCSPPCISSSGIKRVSSDKHFFRFKTWNTLWTPSSSAGKLSWYATGPILFRISNGPIYRGFNLPRFPKRITPFQRETFRRTLSPT